MSGKYSAVKITGHHYPGLPDFWEVGQSGEAATIGWFWSEERAKRYCDRMNAAPARPVDKRAFLNLVRSLYNIDLYVIRKELPAFTQDQWEAFMMNPPRFLIAADEPTSAAIWKCVFERQRPEVREALKA